MHVDIERMSDAVECVKRRHRNAAPPELHVVFARIDPFGRFGGANVGALHRAVESRGHCAPQGVVFVTTFKVSDGLGMSAHVASTLSFYIFAVQRRLIFAQVGIIRSHGDGSVTVIPRCVRVPKRRAEFFQVARGSVKWGNNASALERLGVYPSPTLNGSRH
ncbi:hypothetical protein [Caballeronia sp. M1242]|uniref:hypothetical protein n=1 Tax=Caballeronia sp. M1242 TaxID=2814653 RepID=UPI0019D18C6B|nr:hypothetical protein [Caballeronia sp. M1242]QSN62968.1 hypothetical protein JYK05_17680 [Caballeronia sp. M1242]